VRLNADSVRGSVGVASDATPFSGDEVLVKVSKRCVETCGASLHGEIDTDTREFIHRFSFPRGSEALVAERTTEVEGVRLVTFAPNASRWGVECPLCHMTIVVGPPGFAGPPDESA